MALEKLTRSPDPKLTANWNELVTRVAQFGKMRTDGKIILKWVGGVPCLALADSGSNFLIGKPVSEIDPITDEAPGYGDVQPWLLNYETKELFESNGDPITAFNFSDSAIPEDEFVLCVRFSSHWFVVPIAGCPAEAEDFVDLTIDGEGSETANTDEWEACNEDDEGVKVLQQTRTVYNHGGDEKLYGYQREWVISKDGRIVSIGPEVRFEIDELEDC